MNRQGRNGIEWTDATWNPVGGCQHACRWEMPDGSVAQCYAETTANGVARAAYPNGFEAHYWKPARLQEPLKLKCPHRIFLDSMSDLMGSQVPDDQIRAVLDVCRQADWHTFQLLTKAAPRLLKFKDEFPPNVWLGVSMPPTFMMGHRLSEDTLLRYIDRALEIFWKLQDLPNVKWMSLEPLSFDIAPLLYDEGAIIDWLVIGAASNGKAKYQPEREWVENVHEFASDNYIPVFHKGNLEWEPRRAEFPR